MFTIMTSIPHIKLMYKAYSPHGPCTFKKCTTQAPQFLFLSVFIHTYIHHSYNGFNLPCSQLPQFSEHKRSTQNIYIALSSLHLPSTDQQIHNNDIEIIEQSGMYLIIVQTNRSILRLDVKHPCSNLFSIHHFRRRNA